MSLWDRHYGFFFKFRFCSVFFIHMNHSTSKNTKKSVVLKKVPIHCKSPFILTVWKIIRAERWKKAFYLICDTSIAIEMKVNSESYLKLDSNSILYFPELHTSKSFDWNFCQNLNFLVKNLIFSTNFFQYTFLPKLILALSSN